MVCLICVLCFVLLFVWLLGLFVVGGCGCAFLILCVFVCFDCCSAFCGVLFGCRHCFLLGMWGTMSLLVVSCFVLPVVLLFVLSYVCCHVCCLLCCLF